MRGKTILSTLLSSLAAGVLAGGCAFLLDQGLAWLTLGSQVPIFFRHLAAYLVVGAVTGLLSAAVLRFRSQPKRVSWNFAGKVVVSALLFLYAIPLAERVFQALEYRVGSTAALGAAALAPIGLGVWAFALFRLAGRRWIPAAAAGAFTAALGLAVNRNLVEFATEPKALLFDLAVLAATAAAAAAAGRSRWRARIPLIALGIALLAGVIAVPHPVATPLDPPAGERPPHLILVVIDTLRYDVFRSVVAETPEGQEFRRILGSSAWFTNAVAAAPWTIPAMGSLLTGLYPREHGLGLPKGTDRNRPIRRLAPSAATLTERLRNRHYWTEGIVANPLLHPTTGISRGFLHYEVLMGPTVKLPLLTALGRARLLNREYYQWASEVRRHLNARLDTLEEQAARGRPVFLYLHLMDPHDPLYPRGDLRADPTEGDLPEQERRYRRETRYALAELTRMADGLRQRGLWDDALVVVVSDHGEMFPSDGHDVGVLNNLGEPKLYGHGHAMYEELLHVPLVIRPPGGLAEDREVDALTSHVDLLATLGDLLGLDLRPAAARLGEGGEKERVSLAPWLAAEPPQEHRVREHALAGANQIGPRQRALRHGERKLIRYYRGDRPDELYDLAVDPQELQNLADQDQEELQVLRLRLREAWEQLGEPPVTDATRFDAETRQRLKALGYLQ